MEVLPIGPIKVGSLLWRSPRGGWVLTIAAKATFDLAPGEARLAERQEEVHDRDRPFEADGAAEALRGSVHAPNDLVPFKPHVDVVLVGHAHAAQEEPVRAVVARLVVGDPNVQGLGVDKSIEVVADRALVDGEVREGEPFRAMPLRYERASGGPETWNPVGRDGQPDAAGRVPLPNLQRPGDPRGPTRPDPVGFGPLSEVWWTRRERLGRHAKAWSPAEYAERPLPDDIDPSYFNAAPVDQRLVQLREDAAISLDHLNPTHPRLLTRLPGLRVRAWVEHAAGFAGGAAPEQGATEVRMAPDTLWIETDRATAAVTWRGQVLLEGPQQPGTIVVAIEHPSRPLTWADVARSRAAVTAQRTARTEPGLSQVPPEVASLPFSPREGAPPERARETAPPPPPESTAAPAPSAMRAMNTPPSEDVMTFSAALASGNAPPWLAKMRAGGAPSSSAPASGDSEAPGSEAAPSQPPSLESTLVGAGQVLRAPASVPPVALAMAPERPSALAPPSSAAHDATVLAPRHPTPTPLAAEQPPAAARVPVVREALELLWFDEREILRIAPWRRGDAPLGLEVRIAIARAHPSDALTLARAAVAAIDESGFFEAPVARVDGELELIADPLAKLRALATAARALMGADSAIADLAQQVAAAAADHAPLAAIEPLAAELREPLERSLGGAAALDAALLATVGSVRAWARCTVFGGVACVAALHVGDARVTAYLHDHVVARLPLGARHRVSVVAAVHERQDPADPCPISLRILALARRVAFPLVG